MDLDLSEEQKMLKRQARDFLTVECPTSLVRQMEEDDKGYPPELWRKMAELGWHGLIIPEKYGGTGGSFLDLIILLEEIGRALVPGPFFSTVVLGGLTILELGTESQKEEFLPQIAKGDIVLTLAVTEPGAINDLSSITTTATRADGGYIIDGVKMFVPDAHVADYIVCATTTPGGTGAKGLTLFLVDTKKAPVSCTLLRTTARGKQFEAAFNKVRVGQKDMLGGLSQGQLALEKVLQKVAVAKCAEMVGAAERVLEMSVDYAKQRIAFGRPIGSFQAMQHLCANMLIDVDSSRLLTYEAAWNIDEGLPCAQEAAMAKAWVSDAVSRVVWCGSEIHGGVGFMEEHDMPLYYRRLVGAGLNYGTATHHRELVARAMGL